MTIGFTVAVISFLACFISAFQNTCNVLKTLMRMRRTTTTFLIFYQIKNIDYMSCKQRNLPTALYAALKNVIIKPFCCFHIHIPSYDTGKIAFQQYIFTSINTVLNNFGRYKIFLFSNDQDKCSHSRCSNLPKLLKRFIFSGR